MDGRGAIVRNTLILRVVPPGTTQDPGPDPWDGPADIVAIERDASGLEQLLYRWSFRSVDIAGRTLAVALRDRALPPDAPHDTPAD